MRLNANIGEKITAVYMNTKPQEANMIGKAKVHHLPNG